MNLREKALDIYGKGPEAIEQLLLQINEVRQQLVMSYNETAIWVNRWQEVSSSLYQLTKDVIIKKESKPITQAQLQAQTTEPITKAVETKETKSK